MAMKTSFIPSREGDFNEWFKALVQYVTKKTSGAPAEWKHIPAAAIKSFADLYNDWYACYSACFQPHIKSVTDDKRKARKRAEDGIRKFKKQYLDVDEVSDASRIDMGIPIKKKKHVRIDEPQVPPGGMIMYSITGVIEIVNISPLSKGYYDERALESVIIGFGILPSGNTNDKMALTKPPVSGDELPHTKSTYKKSYKLNLQGESGNTIYISMCYQNRRGERGPWGPMLKAIIP